MIYFLLTWSLIVILKYVEYDKTHRITYDLGEFPRIHRHSDFFSQILKIRVCQEYAHPILEQGEGAELPVDL